MTAAAPTLQLLLILLPTLTITISTTIGETELLKWNCTGCRCDNESNSRSLSWSSSVYPAMQRRIWQTTVSSSLISACTDWNSDVYCSTIAQHLWRSVFCTSWTTPVELITF